MIYRPTFRHFSDKTVTNLTRFFFAIKEQNHNRDYLKYNIIPIKLELIPDFKNF